MKKFNKKLIGKFVVGIVVLLIIVVGATYAYFVLSVENLTDTTRVTSNMEEVGSIALKLENNIYMNLKAYDMQQWEEDVTYYASSEGTTTEKTETTIAYTQATGNHTYTCTYTLEVTDESTNSTYEAFQNMSTKSDGQIVLTVDGVDYDFNTESLFPLTITGEIENVSSTTVGEIKAKYKMVNSSEIDQSALADTDMKLIFTATEFECEVGGGLLAAEVRSKARLQMVDFTEAEIVTKDEYLNTNTTYDVYTWFDDETDEETIEATGTSDEIFSYNSSTGKWSYSAESLNNTLGISPSSYDGTSYDFQFSFNLKETAYYQLCYDFGYLNFGGLYAKKSFDIEESKCIFLGEMTPDDKILISFNTEISYGDGSVEDNYFYLKKIEDIDDAEKDYRYTGSKPNNYIEFNGELWRIIGNVLTKESDGTTSNLVKIIRNDSIGTIAYDAKSSGYTKIWGSNTLYGLLNDYYYGALNGTGTEGCYSTKNTTATTCDYTSIGINPESEYAEMIKEVYWNDGEKYSNYDEYYDENSLWLYDLQNLTVLGKIGLASKSDLELDGGWLSPGWSLGASEYSYPYSGYSVKPVVYLSPKVYITDGDGSSTNPYQIGWE